VNNVELQAHFDADEKRREERAAREKETKPRLF